MSDDNELFGSVQDQDDLPIEEDKDYLDELVGEGKKFQTPQHLAKGKVESDRFIIQLQKELQGLRKELDTRISLEEFMERQNRLPKDAPATPESKANENQSEKVSPEDIQTLVRETLTQETQKQTFDANVSAVKVRLTKEWGPNFPKVLEQKAQELGVGKEFLNSLAGQTPAAFYKLIGVDIAKPVEPYVAPPTSSVERRSSGIVGHKTFHDFEKLRKSNPREYWQPHVQNEMHRLAHELGERFYQK